jgi:hypothetical protein
MLLLQQITANRILFPAGFISVAGKSTPFYNTGRNMKNQSSIGHITDW